MCYKVSFISHYNTLWHYYTLLFFLLFSYYDTLFSFLLFFLLFSIMAGCQHPQKGNVQTAIIEPFAEEWVISVDEECQLNCIDWQAHIKNGKQPDAVFQDHYTHYFYYYAHYFSWLTGIAVTVETSFALLIYEHLFYVLQWA